MSHAAPYQLSWVGTKITFLNLCPLIALALGHNSSSTQENLGIHKQKYMGGVEDFTSWTENMEDEFDAILARTGRQPRTRP